MGDSSFRESGTGAVSDPDAGDSLNRRSSSSRILNLLFVFNIATKPLTTSRIIGDPDLGYGSRNIESDKRKFKRDRKSLADRGVIIKEIRDEGAPKTQESRWAIDRERTFAQRDDLLPEDVDLLAQAIDATFALHGDNLERWPLQRAYLKIRNLCSGGTEPEGEEVKGAFYDSALQVIWSAFSSLRPVRLAYRDSKGELTERVIEVYGTFEQGSRSYIVGRDVKKDGIRTFRTDRIENAKREPKGRAYTIPESFDVGDCQFLPFDFSDAPETLCTFSFPSTAPLSEVRGLTHERGGLSEEEGRTVWTCGVRDLDAAAAMVLAHRGMGMRASGPTPLIDAVRDRISKAVAAHE